MAYLVVLKQLRAPKVLLNRFATGLFRPTIATDVLDRFSFTRRMHHDHEPVSLVTETTVPRSFKREDAQNIFIFIDMPGISKKDVDVTYFRNGGFYVEGEVLKDFECESRKYCSEFELPKNIDRSGIKAVMKDGVVKVTLPKTKNIQQEEDKEQDIFKIIVN